MTDIADMFFVFTLSSNSLDQGDVYVSSEPVFSVVIHILCFLSTPVLGGSDAPIKWNAQMFTY